MGLYIFKYCVNMSQSEIRDIANIDIEQRLYEAFRASQIFGTVGHGEPVTDNVFIIKADNYNQCLALIYAHKEMAESSAWQRETFGEFHTCNGVLRKGILTNKIHMVSQENSKGFKDVILYYKVSEEIKDKIQFFDAMAWARSCKEATVRYFDLGTYKKFLVYKTGV